MRLAMVVPTYWGRRSSVGWQEGDLVFDHPTPLDGDDTLQRLLDSLSVLNDLDLRLAIVVVPTTPEVESEALERVEEIVERADPPVPTRLLTPGRMKALKRAIGDDEDRFDAFYSLAGYAQVRNACLIAARLMVAEAAVLIDDDEVFEDAGFIGKVREGLARRHEGKPVLALAGYYLNPDGDYLLKKEEPTWGARWPKYATMDEGFSWFIGRAPRYKVVPFAFGGNYILHRDLYTSLPFDTRVTRGEDLDYLTMALMSGVPTVLDNELSIKHLAPPKSHPQWQQVRQDFIRFTYQRAKLSGDSTELHKLRPEDFDPYPGLFLRDDLDERIAATTQALTDYYHSLGDVNAAEEAARNTEIAAEADDPDAIDCFIRLRDLWREFMGRIGEIEGGEILD